MGGPRLGLGRPVARVVGPAGRGGGALVHPGIHYQAQSGNASDILLTCARTVCPELTEIGGGPGRSDTPVSALQA